MPHGCLNEPVRQAASGSVDHWQSCTRSTDISDVRGDKRQRHTDDLFGHISASGGELLLQNCRQFCLASQA